VTSFEKESSTILQYKGKSKAKGLYTEDFLDLVTIHQVIDACVMNEAIHIMGHSDRPYVLVSTQECTFVPSWDLGLEANMQEMIFTSNFGGLYCGCAYDSSTLRPGYTAVRDFSKNGPYMGPNIVTRPLLKDGPSQRIVWTSWPLLMHIDTFKTMRGCTSSDAALHLMQEKTFWSTKRPVALTNYEDNSTIKTNYALQSPESLLGIHMNTASPMEIIMKFGSIGTLQWLLAGR